MVEGGEFAKKNVTQPKMSGRHHRISKEMLRSPKCGVGITEFAKKCDTAKNSGQTSQNFAKKNVMQPKMRGKAQHFARNVTNLAKNCYEALNAGQTSQNLQRNATLPKMRGRHHRIFKEMRRCPKCGADITEFAKKCDAAQNAGQTAHNLHNVCRLSGNYPTNGAKPL